MKTGNQKRKYAHNRYEDIDKYIWKVFDTFGHDEKIENLVYWTRKLQKERAEFRKKAVKYDKLTETPTLEQIKQEWEDLNCEWLETDKHIFIHSKESFDGITFPTVALLYKENKTYVSNYIFDIKTHKLLTETMKSLGWFDE